MALPKRAVSARNGTQTTSFAGNSFDSVPNSQYPFTPTLGQDFTSRLSTMASSSRSQSESYANLAQQSTSSAITRFNEIRNSYSQGQSSETATGQNQSDSIGSSFSEVDSASKTLQQQYGLSRRAADDITVSWFLNGEGALGLKGGTGIGSASLGIKGGRNKAWTDSDIGIASEDRSRIIGSLKQISDSRNWSSSREGFVRNVSSSSSSQVSSNAAGLTKSLTEAQTYTAEARRSEELASRLENQAGWYENNSAAGSLNLSQAYREWGMGEIERNRDYYGNARFDDVAFQMSGEGQELQAHFVDGYADRLQADIEGKLVLPEFAPVSRPTTRSANDVRSGVSLAGGGHGPVAAAPDNSALGSEVADTQSQGRQRIKAVKIYTDKQTKKAKGASEEAADDIKKW